MKSANSIVARVGYGNWARKRSWPLISAMPCQDDNERTKCDPKLSRDRAGLQVRYCVLAHVACGLFSWSIAAELFFQVASLHLQSNMDISFRFTSLLYFFLLIERSGRRKPPAERSALCMHPKVHNTNISAAAEEFYHIGLMRLNQKANRSRVVLCPGRASFLNRDRGMPSGCDLNCPTRTIAMPINGNSRGRGGSSRDEKSRRRARREGKESTNQKTAGSVDVWNCRYHYD